MQMPDYADESLFIDQEITVGKEPYYLRGFLTVPTDRESFPLVILVQGSGSHDADVTIGPNKIFRDIAWGLASRGIGVLRYEKRTYRYGSQIIEEGVIPIAEVEYIDDLVVIVEQARTIPGVSDIILAGHSLGGSVVPWVAEETEADGIILLAASPKRLAEISLGQNIDLAEEYGVSQEVLDQVIELFNMILDHALPEGMIVDPQFGITTDYYYSFDRYLAMPVLK
ncbi:MAG TPA: dienelactone hydrolase, partial [Kosmotogaceae bacterium]|nr:dienelactone hydrolase [Kosmotogaceae bacterium]